MEFCAPNAIALALIPSVPTLSCVQGGGRAKCNTVGLLLCTYPTTVPRECVTTHGMLTALATQELCTVAAPVEVTEIVPTFAP